MDASRINATTPRAMPVGILEDIEQQHLDPDKHQDQRQTILEQGETISHPGQQEVHGAQAHDGEDVGGQHDEGIRGHREDGRGYCPPRR